MLQRDILNLFNKLSLEITVDEGEEDIGMEVIKELNITD